MRTSHKEMRRRINNEVSKITEEELLKSRAFAAYLTDIAEAVTQRYRRKLRVKTIYDPSEGATVASTDNQDILINTGNYITESLPNRRLKVESILGFLGHEIGHMLYTNFKVSAVYFTELAHGRLYPQATEELSEEERDRFTELLEFLETGTEPQKISVLQSAKHILNILEDAYIEAMVCHRYCGNFSTGIQLNNLRFTEMIPSISEQIQNGYYRFSVFCNILNQYCRSGDIHNPDEYEGEILERFYAVLPLVDEVIYDDDMKQRCRATNGILLSIWDYIREVAENAKEEQQKTAMNDDETAEKIKQQLQSQIPTMTTEPVGTSTPVLQDGKFDEENYRSEREQLQEMLQEVLEEEAGRLPWRKTEDFDEGNEGGIFHNPAYNGLNYCKSADDISRILTSVAEEKVQKELFQEVTEEMQEEADHIRLGNAHSGIRIIINRMQTVDDFYIRQYQVAAPPLLAISKQMQKRLYRLFRDTNYTEKQTALLMGRRIEPRNLMDREGRIFSKKRLPGNRKSLAVAVLLDESGSMSGQDRVTYARAAGIILYDFCRAMDVPILIMGHTDDGDVQLYAYTDFDSTDERDRYRLMDLSARYGNRDGAALRYVAERLLKQPEENKLLMIVSDGQPAGSGGYIGSAAEADLRGIKKEYTNKGILFVAAAIGADKENIERIYQDAFLDITDLTKLPFLLVKKIEKELKG